MEDNINSQEENALEGRQRRLHELEVGSLFRFDKNQQLYRLTEVKIPSDNGDAVWAYEAFETGDHIGLLVDGRQSGNYTDVMLYGTQTQSFNM